MCMSSGRTTKYVLIGMVLGAVATSGVLLSLPHFLAPSAADSASCLTPSGDETVCKFVGAPLEVEGTPVFLEPLQQAFFPTRGELSFVDAEGAEWRAPPRTLTDGATIPLIFAPLIGDRQAREYVLAAAMHDAYCGIGNDALETYQTRPWPEVHRMFYEALLVGGTAPHKAKIMFAAVYLGGPRWNDAERSLATISEQALRQEMEWCLYWIDRVEPTADQIERWMLTRERGLLDGTQTEPDWDAIFRDGV